MPLKGPGGGSHAQQGNGLRLGHQSPDAVDDNGVGAQQGRFRHQAEQRFDSPTE